jgi:hypothetical protein
MENPLSSSHIVSVVQMALLRYCALVNLTLNDETVDLSGHGFSFSSSCVFPLLQTAFHRYCAVMNLTLGDGEGPVETGLSFS